MRRPIQGIILETAVGRTRWCVWARGWCEARRPQAGTCGGGRNMLEDALRTTPLTPELQAVYDTFGVKIEGTSGFTNRGTPLRFGADIAHDQLWFLRSGNNL
jgi:hypothetical protein